jgi:hypothetical protein
MLTEKVKELRNRYSPNKASRFIVANLIYDELIDNCKPTAHEFFEMADGVILPTSGLYRLIMEAKEKWG